MAKNKYFNLVVSLEWQAVVPGFCIKEGLELL